MASVFRLQLVLQMLGLSQAIFSLCNNSYNIDPYRSMILQSPYYPSRYPSGTACLYTIEAPLDYEIDIQCDINIDKNTTACTTEHFFISREGDPNLDRADQFCGSGSINRTTLFRRLVIAYTSEAPSYSGIGGTFLCYLKARPQPCDCGWSQSMRIVGGENASELEYPSMVGLYHIPSKSVFCGGTIIDHRTIVSATHCIRYISNPSEILILAGKTELGSNNEPWYTRNYTVFGYLEHPDYNPITDRNDIVLLYTTTNIEWSRGVGPICLPFDRAYTTFDYAPVDIVGWGTTLFGGSLPKKLQKASLTIVSNSDAQHDYPFMDSSQVCTYFPYKDSCQKDSGGPVIYKDTIRQFLLGIISQGSACGYGPGLNTRVTSFLQWIRRNAGARALCFKEMYYNNTKY